MRSNWRQGFRMLPDVDREALHAITVHKADYVDITGRKCDNVFQNH